MKTLALAALATLALVPSASADPTPRENVRGSRCLFLEIPDPVGPAGTRGGVVVGGPITYYDTPTTDPTGNPVTGTITCIIQTGSNTTHSGADAATLTSPTTPVVAFLLGQVSFTAGVTTPVWVCTQIDLTDRNGDSVTYYWSASANAWSTSMSVACPSAAIGSTR